MTTLRKVQGGAWIAGGVAVVVLVLLAVTSAAATQVRSGNLIVDFNVGFLPTTLPKTEDVPVKLFGGATLRMSDGTYPPVARFVEAEFERSGYVETRGLPICPPTRLEARTPPAARKACPDSIVGTGFGEGVVLFPEQAPIEASSPITFFNGPPIGGDPTVIAHAYLAIPAPTAILVRFRIRRLPTGYFGTKIEANVPELAGGAGSLTRFRVKLDRRWTYRGKEMSYINGHCAHPGLHRFARGKVEFRDGTLLSGSIFATCQIAR
jgi:hypothetical protein